MSTSLNSYTSADLITDITTGAHIPVGNSTFTEQKLLDLANGELMTHVLQLMLNVREGYHLAYTDMSPTADGVYDIPSDAISQMISMVQIVNSTSLLPVNRIEISELTATDQAPTSSYGFFIKNNSIILLPYSSVSGYLRVWYYRRPSTIILTTAAAKVVSVATNAVTVTSVPSGWVTGDIVDLQQSLPNFKLYASSIAITNVSSPVITIASGGSNLLVNDYLTPHNMSPIVQIPVELRQLLVQHVVCKIYEIQNYDKKLVAAREDLKETRQAVLDLISPRVQEQAKVIYPVNGGVLSGRPGRRGFMRDAV